MTPAAAPATARRVVKAHRVRVIDDASREEAALLAEAAQREDERRAELDAAYRSGLEDGHRAATQAGTGALPALVAAIERAGTTLAAQAAADRAAVIELGLEVARWIAGHELAEAGALVARLDAAMATVVAAEAPVVRVAPSLVDDVRAWLDGTDGRVVADLGLAPGEAVLSAGDATATLTLDVAVARAREALLGVAPA